MSHVNAILAPKGRLMLARCVVEEGWPLRRAAERFQVSATTASRWAARYREQGEAGMLDRSSRPTSSPQRTPRRTERRIIAVRVNRRWGPARIGYLLGLHPSTVHKVLTRYGLAKLTWLDRATGRVIRRYEYAAPGDLVHVDIKKLGRIPDGGGHRVLDRGAGQRNRTKTPLTPLQQSTVLIDGSLSKTLASFGINASQVDHYLEVGNASTVQAELPESSIDAPLFIDWSTDRRDDGSLVETSRTVWLGTRVRFHYTSDLDAPHP